jgi:hypothetical protein
MAHEVLAKQYPETGFQDHGSSVFHHDVSLALPV